jgi:hypothetical protein
VDIRFKLGDVVFIIWGDEIIIEKVKFIKINKECVLIYFSENDRFVVQSLCFKTLEELKNYVKEKELNKTNYIFSLNEV